MIGLIPKRFIQFPPDRNASTRIQRELLPGWKECFVPDDIVSKVFPSLVSLHRSLSPSERARFSALTWLYASGGLCIDGRLVARKLPEQILSSTGSLIVMCCSHPSSALLSESFLAACREHPLVLHMLTSRATLNDSFRDNKYTAKLFPSCLDDTQNKKSMKQCFLLIACAIFIAILICSSKRASSSARRLPSCGARRL